MNNWDQDLKRDIRQYIEHDDMLDERRARRGDVPYAALCDWQCQCAECGVRTRHPHAAEGATFCAACCPVSAAASLAKTTDDLTGAAEPETQAAPAVDADQETTMKTETDAVTTNNNEELMNRDNSDEMDQGTREELARISAAMTPVTADETKTAGTEGEDMPEINNAPEPETLTVVFDRMEYVPGPDEDPEDVEEYVVATRGGELTIALDNSADTFESAVSREIRAVTARELDRIDFVGEFAVKLPHGIYSDSPTDVHVQVRRSRNVSVAVTWGDSFVGSTMVPFDAHHIVIAIRHDAERPNGECCTMWLNSLLETTLLGNFMCIDDIIDHVESHYRGAGSYYVQCWDVQRETYDAAVQYQSILIPELIRSMRKLDVPAKESGEKAAACVTRPDEQEAAHASYEYTA